MKRIIVIAALAAACAACASAKPTPQSVAAEVTAETLKVEERERTLSGLQAVVDVALDNEGTSPVLASGATWELVSGGKMLRSGRVTLDSAVAPGQRTSVTIPVPVEYAPTAQELAAVVARTEPLEYAIRGTVEVAGRTVEYARAFTIRPPRMPVLKLEGVEALHSPSSGLTFTATVELENPNAFALPIQGLTWKILLDGKQVAQGVMDRKTAAKAASSSTYELSAHLDPDELKATSAVAAGKILYAVEAELDLTATKIEIDQNGEARLLREGD